MVHYPEGKINRLSYSDLKKDLSSGLVPSVVYGSTIDWQGATIPGTLIDWSGVTGYSVPGSAITGYIDSDLLSGSWHLESGSFKTGYSGTGIAGSSVHGYLSDDVTINASKIIGTWERHITGGGTYNVTGYGIPADLISGTLSADMLKGTIASGVDVGEMSGYAYNMRIPGGNIQWVTGNKIPGSMINWQGATIPGTLIDWSGVQIPASAITSGTTEPIQENPE